MGERSITPPPAPRRGSPGPGLLIVGITLAVMIAGLLVVYFPEQMGVPQAPATPAAPVGTPLAEADR